MAGFLSASTSMLICPSEARGLLNMDKLRAGAFSDAIDPNGQRSGWVGLGELLDADNFFLAACDGRFAGFSYRLDVKKPSGAVARLKMAEKLREAEREGKKLGSKARKELKTRILEELAMQAPFIPSLTDCLWDAEKGALLVASTSEKLTEKILAHFQGCFGIDARPLASGRDMAEVFSRIQNDGGIQAGGYSIQSMGSASLSTGLTSAEKQAVVAQNSAKAVSEALSNGLAVARMSLVASNDEDEIHFTLDSALGVSGLRLPKAEKGKDREGSFLVNADICARTAAIVETLSAE